ncbi:hypothetical protein Tco_0918617, partial [Tanacetum coccineum]
FVDPEISTQADKAQSPRVPVPFFEDPYEAIRQSYLVETETPKLPHTVASPTSLPDSTLPTRHAKDSVDSDTFGARSTPSDSTALLSPDHPLTHASPTLVPILCRTARMVMRVPPAMSPGLSASIAKEKDEEDEDEEVEETLDSDSESEDAKDEGPTVEDEDPAAGDEALVVKTAVGKPLGLGYEALRHRDIALGEGWIPSVFEAAYIDVPAYPPPAPPIQTPPSPEWSSGSLPVSLAPSIVLSPISSPMILLTVPSPIALPTTAEAEGYLTELGARVEMQGGLILDHTVRLGELSPALFERYDKDIGELFTWLGEVRDEIFSQRYRFRSLEHEQKKVVVTFRAIWRPVLALESWTEERRTRLDLAKIIDGMRRGHEPKGDV